MATGCKRVDFPVADARAATVRGGGHHEEGQDPLRLPRNAGRGNGATQSGPALPNRRGRK